jgi:hypothetical protein
MSSPRDGACCFARPSSSGPSVNTGVLKSATVVAFLMALIGCSDNPCDHSCTRDYYCAIPISSTRVKVCTCPGDDNWHCSEGTCPDTQPPEGSRCWWGAEKLSCTYGTASCGCIFSGSAAVGFTWHCQMQALDGG